MDHFTRHYRQAQLKDITESHKIVLCDNRGRKTKYMNITEKELKVIKLLLTGKDYL